MANEANTNIPQRPPPTRAEERINPVPGDKERMERPSNWRTKAPNPSKSSTIQQKLFTK